MDITPQTNEAPTHTAVPKCCPACGAPATEDNKDHRFFTCGAAWSKHIHRFYSGCRTSLELVPNLLAALVKVRAALNCHYDAAVIESEYGAQIDAAIALVGGPQ